MLGAHRLMPGLESSYPLLVEGVCDAAAQLAAALQHVAGGAGLCAGAGGPALKGVCARLCVRLRDAFMPGGASAGRAAT